MYCLGLLLTVLVSVALLPTALTAPNRINRRVGNVEIVYHVGDIAEHAYDGKTKEKGRQLDVTSSGNGNLTAGTTSTTTSSTTTTATTTTLTTKQTISTGSEVSTGMASTATTDEWTLQQQRLLEEQKQQQRQLQEEQKRLLQQQRDTQERQLQQQKRLEEEQQRQQQRQLQEQLRRTQLEQRHQQEIEKQQQLEHHQQLLEKQKQQLEQKRLFEEQQTALVERPKVEEPSQTAVLPAQTQGDNRTDPANTGRFSYLVNGNNVRKLRVEENNSDGQITGLFGFQQNNGAFRGVQYSADSQSINPKVLYDSILRFFSL